MNKEEIKCNSCGAILLNTDCDYCGIESNYLFMEHDEFLKRMESEWFILDPADIYRGVMTRILCRPDYKEPKEIILKTYE